MKAPSLMDLQRTGFYSRRNNPEPARIQVPDGHVAHVHDQNGVITVFQSGEHYIPRHSRLHWMGPQEEAPDEKQAYSTT